ncbi:MAG TPA: hypothetical protein VGL44_10725, partial [Gaiellales bacterium]
MVLRHTLWARGRVALRIGVIAAAVAVIGGAGSAGAMAGGEAHVRPNAVGELDCNGFSPIQRSVKPTMLCADP